MNRLKYLDGKYMSWEETMEDFHESQKVKRAEEAYKAHLHYLKNGFPDKVPIPSAPLNLPPSDKNLNYAPNQQNHNFNNYNSNISINNNPTPTSHQVPQFTTYQPSVQPSQFQTGFSQLNQFSNTFNNHFPGFGQDQNGYASENFSFDSNQFNQFSNPNTDLFQTQNQFPNTFNNQFPGFGNTFAPKSTFKQFGFGGGIKLPVNFQRIEGTIYEENPNMQY